MIQSKSIAIYQSRVAFVVIVMHEMMSHQGHWYLTTGCRENSAIVFYLKSALKDELIKACVVSLMKNPCGEAEKNALNSMLNNVKEFFSGWGHTSQWWLPATNPEGIPNNTSMGSHLIYKCHECTHIESGHIYNVYCKSCKK